MFHLPCHVPHILNQNYHLLNQMQKPVNQVYYLENQINIKSNTFKTSKSPAFKFFFHSNMELLMSRDKCIYLFTYAKILTFFFQLPLENLKQLSEVLRLSDIFFETLHNLERSQYILNNCTKVFANSVLANIVQQA